MAGGKSTRVDVTAKLNDKAIREAIDVGFEQGLEKGRQEILEWLEHAYIKAPDRPDRGTPKAEALLEMAHAAQQHFLDLTQKKGRGRK